MPNPYTVLRTQFHKLPETDAQAILAHEFVWEDQFAQSIYQSELKDGTILIYFQPKEIDWNAIWQERKIRRIINEWEGKIPKLEFNSIGEYLLFYKAIFHLDGKLALKIAAKEPIANIQDVYKNYPSENRDWKQIEKVLYGSLLYMLNPSNYPAIINRAPNYPSDN